MPNCPARRLAHLTNLKNLASLDLRGTTVDDDAMPHIRALPAIARLDVSDTEIGNEGLKQLAEMTTLTAPSCR